MSEDCTKVFPPKWEPNGIFLLDGERIGYETTKKLTESTVPTRSKKERHETKISNLAIGGAEAKVRYITSTLYCARPSKGNLLKSRSPEGVKHWGLDKAARASKLRRR